MKLGSLFDGIGGFPLAAQRHGITPVWASEIEKFPIEVTKKHFPDMKHLGDITQINGSEIEPVDIITFGSPCQDLSVAGKREGLEGARSGLFMDAVRIIREMRTATDGRFPRFAVWENVPGAFSSNKGEDFRTALEEIAETEIPMPASGKWATAGMVRTERVDIAWRTLDAQHWGVPQRRKRIFLVADFNGQSAGEILFVEEGLRGNLAESRETGQETSGNVGEGFALTGIAEYASGVGLVRAKGGDCGGGSETLIVFNDRQDPTSSIKVASAIDTCRPQSQCVAMCLNTKNNRLDAESQTLIPVLVDQGVSKFLFENHSQDTSYVGPLDVAPIVSATFGTGGNNQPFVVKKRTATAVDCRNLCENEELSGTLQCKSAGGYSLNYQNPVRVGYAVRRLTPTECLRLQGFPDWWLDDVPGYSDTAAYKAVGNSVAIPCVEFVIGRVRKAI